MKETTMPVDRWRKRLRPGDLLRQVVSGIALFRLDHFEPSCWQGESTLILKTQTGGRDSIDTVYGSVTWEILARGLPSDPVPESFGPERDAEGRPVLGDETLVRYACGNVAMVGDIVSDVSMPRLERRVREIGKNVGTTYQSDPIRFFGPSSLRLISRAAPDTIPAPAPQAEPAPDYHALYDAFDKRVRKVLTSVAPLARVVTDQVHANEEREESMLVAFLDAPKGEDGKNPFEFCFPLTMHIEKMELEFREILWTYLGTVGRRAMGGKR